MELVLLGARSLTDAAMVIEENSNTLVTVLGKLFIFHIKKTRTLFQITIAVTI